MANERTDRDPTVDQSTAERERELDERAVRSIPLDTEDGDQVVIEQQNMGGRDQVGGGEFKNPEGGRTPGEAAAEQEELERAGPIDAPPNAPGGARPDDEAPGNFVDRERGDVPEPNEPA